MLERQQSLALFMEGALDNNFGKMGHGVLRYSPNPIVCVIDSKFAGRSSLEVLGYGPDVPVVADVAAAHQLGAEVLLLGIAPPGGAIPEPWLPVIDCAVREGMSVVNGLHDQLAGRYPGLPMGQWVWDIRREPAGLEVGTAAARHHGNVRILLIGTDMAVGKMTAGLELQAAAQRRGIDAAFVATGQIGITITGSGVPLDAIRVDFAGGAIEREMIRWQAHPWVIVEGQGSLIHPSSTANLPLLRGSCPTHLILCHRAGMTHLTRVPEIAVPRLGAFIRMYEDLGEACGTFPRPETAAVALNTAHLSTEAALAACDAVTAETGLPCVDPVRHGAESLVQIIQTVIIKNR